MNHLTLIARSLRHRWRAHTGVVLGAVIGSAILVGALLVGDSVTLTLRDLALARLGQTHTAIAVENTVTTALAEQLAADLPATVAPVLRLPGAARVPNRPERAAGVQTLGVDARFWSLAPDPPVAPPTGDQVVLNQRLAQRLNVAVGDRILLVVERPSPLPRDAILAANRDVGITLALTVAAIAGDAQLGRFGMQSNQVAPYNAFVSLAYFQQRMRTGDRANLLLLGPGATVDQVQAALDRLATLDDLGLEVRALPNTGEIEMRSPRVFLDAPAADAAGQVSEQAMGVLTYLVNRMAKVGDATRATPYSMVAGLGPLRAGHDAPPGLAGQAAALGEGQMLANTWLRDDLKLSVGDAVELTYFVSGDAGALTETTRVLRVAGVVDMNGLAGDRELLPMFPDMPEGDALHDWEPSFPLRYPIRPEDDDYWEQHRGTPKAFVSLATARAMWGNRFGDLTAVRCPASAITPEAAAQSLRSRLHPASMGLRVQAVREEALATSRAATPFGSLFLGLSMFLVIAALLLMGLLFTFGVQQRGEEIGTLLALGYAPGQVRRLLLCEGAMLALIGSTIGTVAGLGYTRLVLLGLATWWSGAVNGAVIHFHASVSTMLIGLTAAAGVGMGVIALTLRRQGRLPARALLTGDTEAVMALPPVRRGRMWLAGGIVVVCVTGALALAAGSAGSGGQTAAGAFFGAGGLLLLAAITACHAMLTMLAGGGRTRPSMSLLSLGLRGAGRRRGRSLTTIALLAGGVFLVVAVGANQRDATHDAHRRDSGTGGFALFAEATLPVTQDLNFAEGREHWALSEDVMREVSVVAMRARGEGDASCLNLNRIAAPRLLGVEPAALADRHAFRFANAMGSGSSGASPWTLLEQELADGAVPAVGDAATVQWGLGKSVGDTVEYADERGQRFLVRIVGVVEPSILQGVLLISRGQFVRRYPSEGGDRVLLIDAPAARATEVRDYLEERLTPVGLEATLTSERLAMFSAVENTYLAIFQALGGLGLLLGTAGLGVVVLRNALERRAEWAALRAMGFSLSQVRRVVMAEHVFLLALGTAAGSVAAGLAVWPAVARGGGEWPAAGLALLVGGITAMGLMWTAMATRWALRGELLAALRSE